MKLYCYYTRSYQVLVDEWFAPSVPGNLTLVLKMDEDDGRTVEYMQDGWTAVTRKKVDFIIEAIHGSWGKVFLFSDPDVRFYGSVDEEIESSMRGRDLAFQKDNPNGGICTGFFACRANRQTLRLWQDVRERMQRDPNLDDQRPVNTSLRFEKRTWKTFLRRGGNRWGVRWGLLSPRFFGGGALTGKHWTPGMELEFPPQIVLHHANWTVGLRNKIAQLRYVKSAVGA